jgi:CubicO group peptidase (beta-lactamase class C family)
MRSGIKITFSPGKAWDERMTSVQQWNGVNKYPELKSVLDFGVLVTERDDVKSVEAYDYQCINTEMLGMIVARVTGKSLAEAMQKRLWNKVGFENNAIIQSNSNGEAVGSGGLNTTTRNVALMMDVLVNGGKNRAGKEIVPKQFIDNLLAGNDEVRSAWKKGKEFKLAPDAWYKDQIRTFNIEGHKFLAFVGIHGQVTIGEPSTKIVISMNGAQDEMHAPRTVLMTFMVLVPALLDAVSRSQTR